MAATAPRITEGQHARLARAVRPKLTIYNSAEPISVKQQVGLLLPQDAVLYGGAAGGGKSSWLLHAAAQYVDVPGYSAILFRRTYKQLSEAGALMDRSKLWWGGRADCVWSETDHRWTFYDAKGNPAGKIAFGHLEAVNDWMKYQGPEYQFVGFDELTQFTEKQFRFLFSRMRKPKPPEQWPADVWAKLGPRQQDLVTQLSQVPIRMRVASNPGGPGHEWVKQYFGIYSPEEDLDPRRLCERPEWVAEHNRVFLPAKVRDNPGLNIDQYIKQLNYLDPTTLAQYLNGDWDAKEPGEFFRRDWFPIVDVSPDITRSVRYWDLAATEPSQRNSDPDWTVGLKMGLKSDGTWIVLDVKRGRWRSEAVEKVIQATAAYDGIGTQVGMEQEPGASGKALISHYQRNVLAQFSFRGYPPADSKQIRARPVASKCEAGLVSLLRGPWIMQFLDECEAFPPEKDGGHDDQVDTLSGAFSLLSGPSWRPM
jgi:predicted phage terminase large subunit-like protein